LEPTTLFLQPLVQYGFLGFSAVLLGVVIWLIKRLLIVITAMNTVVSDNTAAMKMLTATVADLMILTRSLHDKLISRPCIANRGKGTDSDRLYRNPAGGDR
jgi:hypothetical protein